MKKKLLAAMGLGATLLGLPFIGAQAEGPSLDLLQQANPEIVAGNQVDVFPAAPSAFGGLNSILILNNFLANDASVQVCTLPAGGTSLGCTGLGIGPRQTLFLSLQDLQQASVQAGTTAQIQVLSISNQTFVNSALAVFSDSGGLTYIQPFQFQAP